MSQEFSTEDGITSTLCCLPLQLKTQPCCDASLLQDALKVSLQSKTSLWGLEEVVAQAKLPVQEKEMPKAEISQSQLLIVQSYQGVLLLENARETLKTCSQWPGTESTVLLPEGCTG